MRKSTALFTTMRLCFKVLSASLLHPIIVLGRGSNIVYQPSSLFQNIGFVPTHIIPHRSRHQKLTNQSPSFVINQNTNPSYLSSLSSSSLALQQQRIKKYNPSTDFTESSSWPYTAEDFKRQDEDDDTNFYIKPRFVKHVDEWATLSLAKFYQDQLLEIVQKKRKEEEEEEEIGLDILDLCSSWVSHLPPTSTINKNKNNDDDDVDSNKSQPLPSFQNTIGLGLNAEEMEYNDQLTKYYVQNLNTQPHLSQFQDESFDVVLCSLSVDYLIQPQIVFREIQRVLKSDGGVCIMTFGNRYFRKKAVCMWLDGDESGRMDIVASYFYHSQNEDSDWKSIESFDIKLPRTMDAVIEFVRRQDLFKWFATAIFRGTWATDPIYAVKAVKK